MTNEAKKDDGEGGADGGPWEDIKRMADEVRLKLHLAGMEVKDRWAAFEPKVHAVQSQVEAKGGQAVNAVQEQVQSVVDGLRRLLDDLRGEADGKKKAGADAEAVADGAAGAGDKGPGPGSGGTAA